MLKVSFIGLGWVTNNVWVPSLKQLENITIIGGVDASKESRENFIKASNCQNVFFSPDEYTLQEADLTIIATPNNTHADFAKIAIKNKSNVLIEKPVCLSLNEWHMISKLAKSYDVKIFPSNAARYRKDINDFLSEINRGTIGEIRSIEAEWIRSKGIPGQKSWFVNKEQSGGGVLIDLGWHLIDIIFLIIKPQYIYHCISSLHTDFIGDSRFSGRWKDSESAIDLLSSDDSVEDTGICSFLTKNNSHIIVKAAWASHRENDRTKFLVVGDEGEIELHTTFGFSDNRIKNCSITLKKDGQERKKDFDYEEKGIEYTRLLFNISQDILNNKTDDQQINHIESILQVMGLIYE